MRDKNFTQLAEAAPMIYALARILCTVYCDDSGKPWQSHSTRPFAGTLGDTEIRATWGALQKAIEAADMGPEVLPELRMMVSYMDGAPEELGAAAYKALF